MKKKKHALVRTLFIAIAAIVVMLGGSMSVSADLDSVRDSGSGVMRFNMLLDGESKGRGSCFLINDTTIITANHCVKLSDEEYSALYNLGFATREDVDSHLTYSVTLSRDLTISATVINQSESMDFAILKLEQPLTSKKAVRLRSSSDVKAAEIVYSVGYPGSKDTTGTYDESDLVFEQGVINRAQYTDSIISYGEATFFDGLTEYHINADLLLASGGTFTHGNSGGPLIDENGNAVGICVSGNEGKDTCSAIALDQVISVLDDLSIGYTSNISTTNQPSDRERLETLISDCESLNEEDYTEETWSALDSALEEANAIIANSSATESDISKSLQTVEKVKTELKKEAVVQETKEPVVDPSEKNSDDNKLLIIILLAVIAVLVIAGIIIVTIVMVKKKASPAVTETNTNSHSSSAQEQNKAQQPSVSTQQTANRTSNIGETTILTNETTSEETTVLTQTEQKPLAYLVRVQDSTQIAITKSDFKLGKESTMVDYCISGNPSISRLHATIKSKNGKFYIVDNKTTNHTSVNDKVIPSNYENELSSGDIITMSNEKFEFKLS